jgi:hypothetical protein
MSGRKRSGAKSRAQYRIEARHGRHVKGLAALVAVSFAFISWLSTLLQTATPFFG